MRSTMTLGREHLDIEVAESSLIPSREPPAPLEDPAAAVRAALEAPFGYPPLRRALTPDDRVVVILDERLPLLVPLLVPLLEHLAGAGVDPAAITLLCPPSASRQPWVEDLPDAFLEAHVEVHDPANRQRLSYLATSRGGRRLYLNRTVVDADQVVVLSGRRYDALTGHAGAEGAIYPALADEATRTELHGLVRLGPPGTRPWPTAEEAAETTWLLGAPFFVQIVESSGDGVARVVAGSEDAVREGQHVQDALWRQTLSQPADVVLAALSGDPERHTFADLAAAAASAARVVRPGGRIVLLSQARPELGPGTDTLRQEDEPRAAFDRLRAHPKLDLVPALRWADAASHARLYLLSGLADDTVEELFATPLEQARQAQRLIDAGGRCLFLQDAHKTLAVLEG